MLIRLIHRLRNLALRLGVYGAKRMPFSAVEIILQNLLPRTFSGGLKRVGKMADGGYIIPDDLENVRAVFSAGVGDECGFEEEFAELSTRCFLADGSVDRPPVQNKYFDFSQVFIEGSTDTGLNQISLSDWVEGKAKGSDLLLQMDIEGSEYSALLGATIEDLNKFRVMVIEFHDFTSIFSPQGNRLVRAVLDRILKTHFVGHVHVNNVSLPAFFRGRTIPNIIEVTFLNRENYEELGDYAKLPSPLDAPNVASLPNWTFG